jgi:hypothetical protein
MGKKTATERAIEQLDGEIAILQAAKQRLLNAQQADTSRKARRKPKLAEVPKGA